MRGRRRAPEIRLGAGPRESESRPFRPARRVLPIDRRSYPAPILGASCCASTDLLSKPLAMIQAATSLPPAFAALFARPVMRLHPTYSNDAAASHRRRRMYHGFF